MMVVLITGGTRSGKSKYTIFKGEEINGKKAYIATAEPLDEEMAQRIEKHKRKRHQIWNTYEEPVKLYETVLKIKEDYDVIVIDCLTLWLSNIISALNYSKEKVKEEIDQLINILAKLTKSSDNLSNPKVIYIVTNEVGMGIVPENEIARLFRDMAGKLNQKVAEISKEVYLMVSGVPVKIKG